MEISEDNCETCDATLLNINYHKDKSPLENGETNCTSCLFCDKILKASIETYLKTGNKRLPTSGFNRPRRGGHSRSGGPRPKRRANHKEW